MHAAVAVYALRGRGVGRRGDTVLLLGLSNAGKTDIFTQACCCHCDVCDGGIRAFIY